MKTKYVQYGCGLSAPDEWDNFDASPTLRIQRSFLLGRLLKRKLNVLFPPNVLYGDIIKGLPVEDNSCDGVYCSHTLEHLALEDFRIALRNTYKILKKDGIFRCVVPDLEFAAKEYIRSLHIGNNSASIQFVGLDTLLGIEKRSRGLKGLIKSFWGNSHHLWMWDKKSLQEELKRSGFIEIRECSFNDCEDHMFSLVEEEGRFGNAAAIECKK